MRPGIHTMKRANVGDIPAADASATSEDLGELEVVNPDEPVVLPPFVVTAERIREIPPFVWFAGGFALGLWVAHKLRE